MKKDELKRLKASVFALIMCFGLCSCAGSGEDVKRETENEVFVENYDTRNYLIIFINDTAVIYEDSRYVNAVRDGYAYISDDQAYMSFIQTPCVVITGKENSIKFATGIVGSDNILFMDFPDGKNLELSIKPNN